MSISRVHMLLKNHKHGYRHEYDMIQTQTQKIRLN